MKHVIVESGEQDFWLDESLPFPTMVVGPHIGRRHSDDYLFQDLIKYYQDHNLQESFIALNTTLKRPYQDYCLAIAIAIHDFTASDKNMVSLMKGDRVQVIDTKREQQGWWKGKLNGKVVLILFLLQIIQYFYLSDRLFFVVICQSDQTAHLSHQMTLVCLWIPFILLCTMSWRCWRLTKL